MILHLQNEELLIGVYPEHIIAATTMFEIAGILCLMKISEKGGSGDS